MTETLGKFGRILRVGHMGRCAQPGYLIPALAGLGHALRKAGSGGSGQGLGKGSGDI